VSSGQAAEFIALLNIAEAGDYIVSSPSRNGGTYNRFHYTLPKLGITVSFVDNPDAPASWRAAVRPNTKAVFGETIANPKNDILDIEAVAAVAHEVGVPLVVVHSATSSLPAPTTCRSSVACTATTASWWKAISWGRSSAMPLGSVLGQ
jgi:O-acetylhomoserine (thiol)-lyase